MVKGLYQIPPRTRMELLHSNIWWSEGVELLNKGFDCHKGLTLHRKGVGCVDDIWDSNNHNFYTWEDAQAKYRLGNSEKDDWAELTNKVGEQWRNLLEDDEDTAYPGQ